MHNIHLWDWRWSPSWTRNIHKIQDTCPGPANKNNRKLCMSILNICLSARLPACLPACLPVCPSVRPSITHTLGSYQLFMFICSLSRHKQQTNTWYLQHILPVYRVQITVGQSSDISSGFSWQNIQIDGFPKDIILSWKRINYWYDMKKLSWCVNF